MRGGKPPSEGEGDKNRGKRKSVLASAKSFMARRSHKQRLTEFYRLHNPSKLRDVENTLKSYEGKEEQMFALLEHKYTPNAPPELLSDPVYTKLEKFYVDYAPEKLRDIPMIMNRFRGKEDEMWKGLRAKYVYPRRDLRAAAGAHANANAGARKTEWSPSRSDDRPTPAKEKGNDAMVDPLFRPALAPPSLEPGEKYPGQIAEAQWKEYSEALAQERQDIRSAKGATSQQKRIRTAAAKKLVEEKEDEEDEEDEEDDKRARRIAAEEKEKEQVGQMQKAERDAYFEQKNAELRKRLAMRRSDEMLQYWTEKASERDELFKQRGQTAPPMRRTVNRMMLTKDNLVTFYKERITTGANPQERLRALEDLEKVRCVWGAHTPSSLSTVSCAHTPSSLSTVFMRSSGRPSHAKDRPKPRQCLRPRLPVDRVKMRLALP
jgi:hypothetical protein